MDYEEYTFVFFIKKKQDFFIKMLYSMPLLFNRRKIFKMHVTYICLN